MPTHLKPMRTADRSRFRQPTDSASPPRPDLVSQPREGWPAANQSARRGPAAKRLRPHCAAME